MMICKCLVKGPYCSYNQLFVPVDGVDVNCSVDRFQRLHLQWQTGAFATYGMKIDASPDSQIVSQFVLSLPNAQKVRWSPHHEIEVPDNIVSIVAKMMESRPNVSQDVSAYGSVRSDEIVMGQWA